MAISNDFVDALRQPWEGANGWLIEQWGLLQSQLAPVTNLTDSLNSTISASAILGLSGFPVSSILITDSAAAPTFSSSLPCPLGFLGGAEITPAALSANTNDYTPSGIATAAVVRVSATGAVNLTGLKAATTRQMKLLVNIGAFAITITHADALSSAANRFRCGGAVNITLAKLDAIWIYYDLASGVWQVVV